MRWLISATTARAASGSARARQARQQFAVDDGDVGADLADLRRAVEQDRRLVLEPEAELRAPAAHRLAAARRLPVVAHEDLVRPFQQPRSLALALGRQVLAQEEQAVGLVGARLAVGVLRVALAHQAEREVDDLVVVGDGLGQPLRRPAGRGQAQRQRALDLARAARQQLDRDADACVHLAGLALHGEDLLGRRRGVEELLQPAHHRPVQAPVDDLVVEHRAGARVGEHGGVEAVGDLPGGGLDDGRDPAPRRRAGTTQALVPVVVHLGILNGAQHGVPLRRRFSGGFGAGRADTTSGLPPACRHCTRRGLKSH